MNRFFYFMAVGLAFTALQVATVEAQDSAAGLVTGGNAPADCGGVPCPTGDDAHTGGGEDCAGLATEALRSECEERKSTHAEGDHAGMAAGTTAMCGGVPCPTGDDAHTGGGEDCTGLTGEARTTCEQGHHTHDGPPPIDPRSGAPFTPADMAMYQKYIDECEATEGVLSEGSISVLIVPPHNFT